MWTFVRRPSETTPYGLKVIDLGVIWNVSERQEKRLNIVKEFKKAKWQHKIATKRSITQRLRTDLGRSVGVTTATQLVWLNRFTGA